MTLTIVDEMLAEVRDSIAFAEEKLRNAPEETLRVRRQDGAIRYYSRRKGETDGRYLGRESVETIRLLEEKDYYSDLLAAAKQEEHDLTALKNTLEKMPDYRAVFLSMPREKRHLISPYEHKCEQKNEWADIFNKKYVSSEINLISQNGEHVRSKSELIIADRLKAAGIEYYYEDPVILSEDSSINCFYWHPDFKVLNKRTGKQYYWEHFGMLDNTDYCKSCQEKIEIYSQYGYYPGDNLIITTESSTHSLNLNYVDRIIAKYLK